MMKYKMRMAAAFLAVLMLIPLSGCQLAREDAGLSNREDRLIGVFLTTEYLDLWDFEGYLNDNIKSFSGGEIKMDGPMEQYQGRLYAELRPKTLTNPETGEKTVTEEYIFPGIEGIPYFAARVPDTAERQGYITSGSDEAISDGHMYLNYGDKEDSTVLNGTVYVSPGSGSTYYFNPVYQSEDDRVYALSGSGLSTGGIQSEGEVFSRTLDASYTSTENGKTKSESISVKVSINVMFPPEEITILQMDADSAVVSRREYAPEEIPESITPEANTEYIIVEIRKTHPSDSTFITRKLYGRDVESLETFYRRANGICVKKWVPIKWSK